MPIHTFILLVVIIVDARETINTQTIYSVSKNVTNLI